MTPVTASVGRAWYTCSSSEGRTEDVAPVSAAFSIGTLDETVWRESEPGTPHPRGRIDAIRALTDAGIPTGVLMAPILPGIADRPEQLREVVEAAIDAGATHVSPIMLHLRPGVREEFLPWLEEKHPDLVTRYMEMYRHPYGPKAMHDGLGRQVMSMVAAVGGARRGVEPARRFFRRDRERPPDQTAEQLRLL